MKSTYASTILITLVLFVFANNAEDHFVSLVDLNQSKVYCGHVLTSELSYVCKGKYNALKGKRIDRLLI